MLKARLRAKGDGVTVKHGGGAFTLQVSKVRTIYLSEIHTRWIANHRAIRLSVPSILDQLRVPYPEVLMGFFPLRENGDDRSQVSAICSILQVCFESLEHFFRGGNVAGIEHLVMKR